MLFFAGLLLVNAACLVVQWAAGEGFSHALHVAASVAYAALFVLL